MPSEKKRCLLAFDFDNTVVTDVPEHLFLPWCKRLASPEDHLPVYDVKNMKDVTVYQNQIFGFLHGKGVTIGDIFRQAEYKYLSPGYRTLLEAAKAELNADVIVISDNNSVVVAHMLEKLGLDHLVDEVMTNPGEVNAEGRLVVGPYHVQDGCALSFRNLCKARALNEYVEAKKAKGIAFDVVGYAGDNINDLCPGLMSLSEKDCIFPRVGFPLEKCLEERRTDIKAQICPWDSGEDILKVMREKMA